MSSYQLQTTKRKFDRLLDQITNGAHGLDSTHNVIVVNDDTTLTSPSAIVSQEPTTKRRKLTPVKSKALRRERSTFVKSLPHLSLLLAQQARQISQNRAFVTPPESVVMSRANFNPISQEDFLNRLKSFGPVSQWAPKPDIINEVAWAKQGWRLMCPETVTCDGCHAVQVVDMTTNRAKSVSEQADVQRKLADKYAERIFAAHIDNCFWKKIGCNDTIHRVKIWPVEGTIRDFLERYKRFIRKSEELPDIVTSGSAQVDANVTFHALLSLFPDAAEGVNVSEENIKSANSTADPPDPRLRATCMAIAGWNLADSSGESAYVYAECSMCFRRVGLWLYKPASGAEDRLVPPRSFDVISEHRDYCPWANSTTQCPQGFSFESPQMATELLGKIVFDAALSKARRFDQNISPIQPASNVSSHARVVLAHPLRSHPADALSIQRETLFSRSELQGTQQTQQTTGLGATDDVEAADKYRREKLKGIRRFLGKFQDVSRAGLDKLKKRTP